MGIVSIFFVSAPPPRYPLSSPVVYDGKPDDPSPHDVSLCGICRVVVVVVMPTGGETMRNASAKRTP